MGVGPVRVEGQLAHLVERRLPDLVAVRVADVDREQPRQRIEVALAVHVLEVAALAADDDRNVGRAVAAEAGEVHPEVLAGELLQVGQGRGHAAAAPCSLRALRICHSTLVTASAIETKKMALATTFTCGGTDTRAMPQT